MRLLITGARNQTDYNQLLKGIEAVQSNNYSITHILHGGAKGVDTLAQQYADDQNIPTTIIRPDYNKYGKAAPHLRNAALVKSADLVLAIYGPKGITGGTANTARMALKQRKVLIQVLDDEIIFITS